MTTSAHQTTKKEKRNHFLVGKKFGPRACWGRRYLHFNSSTMAALLNYFFPSFAVAPAPAPDAPPSPPLPPLPPSPPPQDSRPPPPKNVSVCYTIGDTLWTVSLSYVKTIENRVYLKEIESEIRTHLAESWDPEECVNCCILLEEIEKKLRA